MPPPRNASSTGGRLSGEDMQHYMESFEEHFLNGRIRYETEILKIKRVEIVGKHQANMPLEPRPPVAGRHSFGETPVGIGCVAHNARRV